jgi:hypothetical protein
MNSKSPAGYRRQDYVERLNQRQWRVRALTSHFPTFFRTKEYGMIHFLILYITMSPQNKYIYKYYT